MTHDTAYVVYTGKFLDGTVFDSNVGKASLIFPVDEGVLIQGFDEGITYMNQGGKAQFLIPSKPRIWPTGILYYWGIYSPDI